MSDHHPLDALEEAFVGGIATGDADMPEFVAAPAQVAAVITRIGNFDPQ